MTKVYQHIAREVGRMRRLENSRDPNAAELLDQLLQALDQLVGERLPSGSGFDAGTRLYIDNAKPDCYVFKCDFHHMNDGGYYDGWSEHDVVVTPSMEWGFNLRITGRDRNGIKDYIGECFQAALNEEMPDVIKSS
jgi:hypothetical protein